MSKITNLVLAHAAPGTAGSIKIAQWHAEAAAAGPDWIGTIGSCVGRFEQLGKDAVRWADKVNGLQG